MPLSFRPFGFRFVKNLSGSHGNETNVYPLPNGAACPDLAKGSPVAMNGGVLTSVGGGTAPVLGVCTGFFWVDPTTKQPQERSWIPADVSSAGTYNGLSQPGAYVVDNPDAVYMVQADGSVSAGDVGLNFRVTASSGDVDTVYGVSRYTLQASTRTSAVTGAVKLLGLAAIPDNAWNDPFPVVLVKVNRSILTETSAF
jgi:hypothetical protein